MFFRTIAALMYDLMIITALGFFFAAIAVSVNHGEAIPAATRWFQGVLVLIIFSYFYFSLRKGGQTIGMRAWHLCLTRDPQSKKMSLLSGRNT